MKTWVEINKRLFELEKIPEESRDIIWKSEWNSLLLLNIAGTLNRKLYEVEGTKTERKGRKEKKTKRKPRKNAKGISRNME